MWLFDTHAHLDDEAFDGRLDEVLDRAWKAGLWGIVAMGTTIASSRRAVELAEKYPRIHAAVGIQPNHVHEAAAEDWAQLCELSQSPRVVAIGETGLDYYWDYAELPVQRTWFRRHLELAAECGKPFVIHSREGKHGQSDDDCARDLQRSLRDVFGGRSVPGIMHSYSGNQAHAATFVSMGLSISFAGMVTFGKALELQAVVPTIPKDRLLIETDAPYLSPHPLRGKYPNEPARISHTATCVANLRGEPLLELASLTTANACRLFGLESPGTVA